MSLHFLCKLGESLAQTIEGETFFCRGSVFFVPPPPPPPQQKRCLQKGGEGKSFGVRSQKDKTEEEEESKQYLKHDTQLGVSLSLSLFLPSRGEIRGQSSISFLPSNVKVHNANFASKEIFKLPKSRKILLSFRYRS